MEAAFQVCNVRETRGRVGVRRLDLRPPVGFGGDVGGKLGGPGGFLRIDSPRPFPLPTTIYQITHCLTMK